MVIRYVEGPHKAKTPTPKERMTLTHALSRCAEPNDFFHMLNMYYNNPQHHGRQLDTLKFLEEIQRAATHKFHEITVMGTEHSDPYGHSSNLAGQYDDYNNFEAAIMQDHYIRFTFKLDEKNFKVKEAFDILNGSMVFHFLVKPPTLIKLPLTVRRPVVMYALGDRRLMPSVGKDYNPRSVKIEFEQPDINMSLWERPYYQNVTVKY